MLHYEKRGGLTITLYGPARAHASHFLAPENKKALLTLGISGPIGSISSASEHLQQSLENKLRARLRGSDLCEVIWKPWTTPWGQCLSRPRARVRTTDETDIGLWPTVVASEARQGFQDRSRGKKGIQESLTTVAVKSLWSTPRANEGTGAKIPPGRRGGVALKSQVIGLPAQTEKRGALNPAFVCWLMGYQAEWVSCGASGTR